MPLSYFDIYLIGVNILGFLLFTIYMHSSASLAEDSGVFDRILTIVSLLFGSLGMVISILLFGRTPKQDKKRTMMSRVFVSCVLVIQLIIVLVVKGYVAKEISFNIIRFLYEHKWLLYYLGAINIITFFVFALDKQRAIHKKRRIRIVTLLILCFIGGTIGGWLSMQVFRHKTKQDYFAVGLPLMLVMQIVVILFFMNIPHSFSSNPILNNFLL